MLGLLLVYFIWKQYSELAVGHNKSKWGYGLLGIVIYYAGTFLFGLAIGLVDAFAGTHYIEDTNEILLNIFSLPFGILATWGLYKILESNWQKQQVGNGESLDQELLDTNMEG